MKNSREKYLPVSALSIWKGSILLMLLFCSSQIQALNIYQENDLCLNGVGGYAFSGLSNSTNQNEGANALVLMPTCSGNADAVDASSIGIDYSTGNSSAVIGAADGEYAEVYDSGDRLVLDLTDIINAGETYSITWRRKTTYGAGPFADMVIEESADKVTWTENPVRPSTDQQTFTSTAVTANEDVRYLRLRTETNSSDDFDLDAVSYSSVQCGGSPVPSNLSCSASSDEIAGTVFLDFDYDGQYDTGVEYLGLKGVVVSITDSLDNNTTAITNATGEYSIGGLTSGKTYRVEFLFPDSLDWAEVTREGPDNGTAVQYVQVGNCANLGVASPTDFCQPDPIVVTPCYVNGDPLSGGTTANFDFIVGVPYIPSSTSGLNEYYATGDEVGATWGVTYHRESGTMLTSALLKRHTGLGPLGTGGIYKIDLSGSTPVVSSYFSLDDDLGIDTGTDPRISQPLPADATTPNHDSLAFDLVGKMSIGDIDLSDDEKTLWAMNLHDGKLYEIEIPDINQIPSNFTAHTLPDPGCTNGTFRAFATKFYRGKIYVGGVCTAENGGTASDLHAYIYAHDPADNASTFSLVYDFPLDYPRGCISDCGTCNDAEWNPWVEKWEDITNPAPGAACYTQTIHPQPMLVDLEFDIDGSVIAAFEDRLGHQTGNRNYSTISTETDLHEGAVGGDILRISYSNGTYALENNATCGGVTTSGAGNGQGPGGGEYYWQDMFQVSSNPNAGGHHEITVGGLTLLPSSGEILRPAFDPVSTFRAGGLTWYFNSNGMRSKSYEIFGQDFGGQPATFGKASGLGDIEPICDPAPIEIGNYVWLDDDQDGIQDGGENGLENVRMELYDMAGELLAYDSTDASGEYYFSGSGIDNATWITSNDTLQPNTMYYLVVGGGSQFSGGSLSLGGNNYYVTLDSVDSGSNRYEIDSDGTIAANIDNDFNGKPYVKITTGLWGQDDHSFDFGFTASPPCSIQITSVTPSACNPADGTYSLDVEVTYSNQPSGVIQITTSEGGNTSEAQTSSPQTITLTGLTSNSVENVEVTAFFAADLSCVNQMTGAYDEPCCPTEGTEEYLGCEFDGYSVMVNGTMYNQFNPTGTETLTNAAGCDSTVTINLVYQPGLLGTEINVGCSGDGYSVTVNGTLYDESNPVGTEIITGGAFNGCDSTVIVGLLFNPPSDTTITETLCSGESIFVNGTEYSAANPTGSENIVGGAVNGCDSLVTIDLTFIGFVESFINENRCQGDGYSITVNGVVYNETNPTGTENFMNGSFLGCDSIVNIDLNFQALPVNDINQTLCTGESLEVNGTIYNEANPTGTETVAGGAQNGCDSIINVSLTFNSIATNTISEDRCEGDGYSVSVNGTTYDEANPTGTETIVAGSYLGCDSIITVSLNFQPNAVNNLNETLCTGGSLEVNGTTYDEANPTGVETIIGGAANGCDSTINVSLTFNSFATNTINENRCEGDGYSVLVNGTIYDEVNPTGTETIVGGSYLGCDSIITVSLNFQPSVVNNLNQTLCTGGSLEVNGTTYNEANPTGTETIVGGAANGCDSVINVSLMFNSIATNTISEDRCEDDGYSVSVNGTTYDEANPTGTETIVAGSYLGCDSIITVSLNFQPNAVKNLNETLCTGGSLEVNGTTYNEANPTGVETIIGGAANGCDSTINVSLTFNSFATNSINENRCEGDGYSVLVNGTIYDEVNPTGTETIVGGSYLGCDSVITVNLVFNAPSAGTEIYTGCQGDGYSVIVNGTLYNQSNPTGTEVLTNASGCDSTVTVSLIYQPGTMDTETYAGCSGDGYAVTVNGTVYNEANPVGTEIIAGGAFNGCDSTVTIDLSFSGFVESFLHEDRCQGDGFSITVNGVVYDEMNPTGSETFSNGSYLGCDSIVNIDLNFQVPSAFSFDETICEGESYLFDGQMLSSEGTYFDTLTAANGCDSLVTLNLAVQTASAEMLQDSICTGETYSFGGQILTTPGTYYDTLEYSTGCDSLILELVLTEKFDCTEVFDMALEKDLATGQSSVVSIGDTVTFTIKVRNEGDFPAFNILVIDYVPAGFTYSQAINFGWINFGAGPTWINNGPLAAGDSISRDIKLIVNGSATNSNLDNVAEISAADDDNNGGNTPPTDEDSNPNAFQFDDPPSEDDHDNATVILAQPILSLGNLVFADLDNDGIFNHNDYGLEEVEIELYNVGPDGQKGTADDILIATEETNGFGEYLFQNLIQGLYFVKLNGTGIPANFVSSTGEGKYDNDGAGPYEPSTGTDDNVDNEDDGTQMGSMIMSDTIRLGLGEEPGGNENLTVDFGLYEPQPLPTLDLGNLVFADLENDGIFNNDDYGLEEVEVVLFDAGPDGLKNTADDIELATQETNGFGEYLFTGLAEGLYFVKLSGTGIPTNFVSSTGDGPYDNDADGAFEPATGTDNDVDHEDDGTQMGAMVMSDTIRLTAGLEPGDSVNLTVDFGLYEPLPTLSLGNLVFDDKDNDGIFNNADTGLEEVEVVLFDAGPDGLKNTADDIELATTETNGFGEYLFDNLEEGLYFVKLSGTGIPADYVSSTGDGPSDNDGVGAYEPSSGTDNNTDNNDDGSQMGAMVMSDTIRLTIGGEPDGNDNFTVDFGLYQPQVFDLALTKDLAAGQSSTVIVGDTVQFSIVVSNEGTVSAFDITVRDSLPPHQNFVAALNPQWTENNGLVTSQIAGPLAPGENGVRIIQLIVDAAATEGELLENFAEITAADNDQNGGNTPPTDIDSTPDDDLSNDPPSEDDHDSATVEVTVIPTLSLGNLVFADVNNDGVFNGTDYGLEEVEVVLFEAGPDGFKNTADDIEIETQETNGFGEYLFAGLAEGLYFVKLNGTGIPAGFVSSTGDGPFDNDGAGIFEPANFTDNNLDNVDDGTQMGSMVMSDTIRLTIGNEPGGNVNLTVDFGLYQPIELMKIGNQVFHDVDNDGVFNNDDTGLQGVEVELYDLGADGEKNTADDIFVAITSTNADGNYLFQGLGEGVFYVKLNGNGIPTDYVSSTGLGPFDTDGSGPYEPYFGTDDDIDNEDDGTQMGSMVMSDTIRLIFNSEPGVNENLTVDFGLYAPIFVASLGDFVWYDLDHDGQQDAGENGVPGVTVQLFDLGADGVKGGGDDNLIGTTETDVNGAYAFTDLLPGDYYVQFDLNDLPANYFPTSQDTGDDATDSDANSMGMTEVINLAAGENDDSIDMGIEPEPASLGDFVWFDDDKNGQQNGGETGVANVTVNLFDLGADGQKGGGDDNLIATDVTDTNGAYGFTDLEPGDYYVQFDLGTLPTGYLVAEQNIGDDATDSDANAMGMTEVINLAAGEDNPTIDMGIEPEVTGLGDFVWFDLDHDGQQDGNESGVPDVIVNLFDLGADGVKGGGDDNLIETDTTSATGFYSFENLNPGDYYVMFDLATLPTNWNPTTQDVGDDNTDSDANAMGMTEVVTLTPGNFNSTIDMGIEPELASLGDFVWLDDDRDGQQDVDEMGVAEVTVNLFDLGLDGVKGGGDDNLIATDVTDVDGGYGFTDLEPGNYYVQFDLGTLPTGYNPTPQDIGDDTSDSDANAMGMTEVITLAAGENDPTIDMGINPDLASLGDFVWYDLDHDGQQDAGENGVPQITVQLFDLGADGVKGGGDDNLIGTTETDANGAYAFDDLEPGDYYVQFDLNDLPANYNPTVQDSGNDATDSDANAMGMTEVVNLSPGENDETIDMGIDPELASLGDLVWFDDDRDGQQDGGEAGVPDVTVNLFDLGADGVKGGGDDNLIATDVTDVDGGYDFTDLEPGEYYVQFDLGTLPTNFNPTEQNIGDDATDSDANGMGMTAAVNLAAGENNPTIDMGIEPEETGLGDFVWYDVDRDGQQDAGEPGVADVTVNLFDLGADGVKGGGDDNLLETDLTDADGLYGFEGLDPGEYYVQFDLGSLPANYSPTTQDSGNDASDSDANTMGMTDVVTLNAGVFNPTIDFGIEAELASLGDLVWFDDDRDGQQDGGEAGVPDVTVNLFDLGADGVKGGGDDNLIATDVTGVDGAYSFTDLEPGEYYVQFDLGTLPTNFNPTDQNIGDDATDSDVNGMGMTAVVNLAAGENNPTIDMGIEPEETGVGNFVWFDLNRDGQQDAGESGVPEVVVYLYDLGADGVKGGGDDNLLEAELTDEDGIYEFEGLEPGEYYVQFDLGSLPANYFPTTQDSGNDDSDSDANPMGMTDVFTLSAGIFNPTIDFGIEPEQGSLGDLVWLDSDRDGQQDVGENGVEGVTVQLYDLGADGVKGGGDDMLIATDVTDVDGIYGFNNLEPGEFYVQFVLSTLPDNHSVTTQDVGNDISDSDVNTMGMTDVVDLAAGENNPTIDMGITPDPASLGDLVWLDDDLDGEKDGNEGGLPEITVRLFDLGADGVKGGGDDNLIETTETDANGNYNFTDFEPGDYYVQFDLTTLPPNYVVTAQDASGETTDSDANFMGMTDVISLAPGEENTDVDMGAYDPMFDLALYKNLSVDQSDTVDIGDEVKYTIRVENQGLIPAYNILISDHIPPGLVLSPNDPLWTSVDPSTATYSLAGPIQPGQADSVEIILFVQYGLSNATLINVAEIDSAEDQNGVTVNDIDSTPDNDEVGEDDQDDQPIILLEHDPTGYIYCEKTGQVISGGTISVMGPNGILNDEVQILQDGSNGFYEFYAVGLEGIYTVSYSHPAGYPLSTICEAQMGAFDPTGPSNHFFGSTVDNGYLIDTACASNPYYLQFDLEFGDPNIYFNNIPIRCAYISSIVCEDVDLNDTADGSEPPLAGVTVNLYDCADLNTVLRSDVTDVNGRYEFDGLVAGSYRVQFVSPNNYRQIQGGTLDPNGFAPCITLGFGDCDTTTSACMIPCATVDAGMDTTICFGGTAQLLASPNYGNGSYAWTPAAGLNNSNIANPEASPISATNYVVSYDDGLGCTDTDSVTVFVASSVPMLMYTPFTNTTVECTEPIPFDAPIFGDGCDADLTITLDSTITPQACGYIIQRTWTATNDEGNSASFEQTVSVVDTTPPTLTASHPIFGTLTHGQILNADCTTLPSFNVMVFNAWDDCGTVITNFEETTTPADCLADGYIQTMYCGWTATDECGNVDSLYFTVFITDDTAPALNGVPADIAVSCDAVPSVPNVMASDFCDDMVVPTFSETTIQSSTGCDSLVIRTWTVSDDCGNTATESQTISVADTEPPVLTLNNPMLAGVMNGDTMTIECDDVISLSASDATATDNCCTPTVEFIEFVTAASCPDDGYMQFMSCGFVAEDCCGNRDSFLFYVYVTDDTPPTLLNVPADLTLTCTTIAPPPSTAIKPFDNCTNTDQMTVVYSADTVGTTIIRTWTAADECGNVGKGTQTITLGSDLTPPTILNVPADLSISCDENLPALPANVTATDDCDANPTLNFAETSLNDCAGSVMRTWTSSDASGNSISLSQTITVVDDQAPVITGVGPDEIYQCDPGFVANAITVTDNCTPNPLVTLDSDTTQLTCGYQILHTYTATDDCGNQTIETQTIVVNDTEAPTLSGVPADLTIECDQPVPPAANVSANDNCGDATISFEETSMGTCPEIITRTWTATDDCGNATSLSQTITIEDTTPPTMMASHPFFGTINHGDTLYADCTQIASLDSLGFADADNCSVPVRTFEENVISGNCLTDGYIELRYCGWTSTDACGNTDSLYFHVIISDTEAPVLTGVPADLTIECDQPVPPAANVSATDNCDSPIVDFVETSMGTCPEIITRTWTATDSCGNTVSASQTITIEDTTPPTMMANHPFFGVINHGDTLYADCTQIPSLDSLGFADFDNCGTTVRTFEENVMTGTCAVEGYVEYRYCGWTSTDECGNTDSLYFHVIVSDLQAPTITGGVPDDITIGCDESLPANDAIILAIDNCDDTLDVSSVDVVVPGAGDCAYSIERTWTATDDCGNTASATQVISVTDDEAPQMSNLPDDADVACGNIPPVPTVTVTDNCTDSLTAVFTETINGGNCPYTITRTWTATDDCGNVATHTQTLTARDDEAPVFIEPTDTMIACGNPIPMETIQVSDNCDTALVVVMNEVIDSSGCGLEITRTWTATDDCGNVTSVDQIITVVDTLAPEIVFNHPQLMGLNDGDVMTMECDAATIFGVADADATDNCSGADLTFEEFGLTIGDCKTDGFITQISCRWIATDECGNADSITLRMQIVDSNGPVFTNIPIDMTVGCGDTIPEFGDPMATDGCGDMTMIFNQDSIPTNNGYELVGTWTATDECGNESLITQTITVFESGLTVLDGLPFDTVIVASNGEVVPPLPTVTAYDDCTSQPLDVEFEQSFVLSPDGCDTIFTNTWTTVGLGGDTLSASQTVEVINELCPCDIPIVESILTSPAICADSNGAAIVNLVQPAVDYTWTWIPSLGMPLGVGNSRTNLPDGTYMVIAENLACADTFEVNITSDCDCLPAEVDSVAVTSASCGAMDASVTIHLSGDVSDYQFLWIPDLGTPNGAGNERTDLPAAHYVVYITFDGNTDCVEKLEFDIFDDCPRCPSISDESTVEKEISESPTEVCIPVLFGAAVELDVTVNGNEYTTGIQGCDNQDVLAYDYSTAAGMAQSGPFYAMWQYGSEVFSTVVNDMDELAAGMAYVDPVGKWKNDKKSFRLITTNLAGDYDGLMLYHIPSETTTYHGPEQTTAFMGIRMVMSEGEHEVVFSNQNTTCENELLVKLEIPTPPEQIFEDDFVAISGDCQVQDMELCLGISELEIPGYEVSVDGTAYTDSFGACGWETTAFYGYGLLLNLGSPPFKVLEWEVNGNTFDDFTFDNVEELVDKMNEWDNNGNWTINTGQSIIQSSVDGAVYGSLTINHVLSNATVEMAPNTSSYATSVSIELAPGEHEVSITRMSDGLTDTIDVLVACVTTDHFEATIELGESGTVCFDLNELPGELATIENVCDEGAGSPVVFDIDDEIACVEYLGNLPGQTEGCFVLCDEFGVCDSVMVSVTVETATAVEEVQEDGLTIYNGFSPNGDGFNDYFKIDGLDRYPDHELTVYDRFGKRIFQTKNYRSDWGGAWSQNDLPNGTYFYILTDGNGNRRTGYVQVKR